MNVWLCGYKGRAHKKLTKIRQLGISKTKLTNCKIVGNGGIAYGSYVDSYVGYTSLATTVCLVSLLVEGTVIRRLDYVRYTTE